jgi:hypothetical protein
MVVSNIKIVTGVTGTSNYGALLWQLGVEQKPVRKPFSN